MTTVVVSPIEFDGTECELHGDAYHRFVRVKRLRGGESVRVVDGEGRARRGVVARVDRARAVIALAGAEPSRESALRVEVVVAPPEPSRAAWMVEKLTELGVASIRFVATERSARSGEATAAQLARLRRVAHAAVEQCGRAALPELTAADSLASTLADERPRFVLDPSGEAADRLVAIDAARCPGLRLSLYVGPEGGFDEGELARFDAAGVGRISLGDRILRVESAAVVAAALVLVTFR